MKNSLRDCYFFNIHTFTTSSHHNLSYLITLSAIKKERIIHRFATHSFLLYVSLCIYIYIDLGHILHVFSTRSSKIFVTRCTINIWLTIPTGKNECYPSKVNNSRGHYLTEGFSVYYDIIRMTIIRHLIINIILAALFSLSTFIFSF
jgi:hypothetical protein